MSNAKIDNYIQFGLLIITIISIVSPVIVTIINNHHDYKVRISEYNSKIKQEILSEFCSSITKEFNSEYIHKDFYKNLNLLHIYFDVDDTLINKITTNTYDDINAFQKDVTKLMKLLSKQVKYK